MLGGDFLSRLNTDIREEKGWSYGVSSGVAQPVGPRTMHGARTGSVRPDRRRRFAALIADMKAFPATQPGHADELQRVTDGAIRGLPNEFETNGAVPHAIRRDDLLGRPDDYYTTLAAKLRAIDAGTDRRCRQRIPAARRPDVRCRGRQVGRRTAVAGSGPSD